MTRGQFAAACVGSFVGTVIVRVVNGDSVFRAVKETARDVRDAWRDAYRERSE